MNVFKLVLHASIVVQGILLILLFFSIFSWAIIIFKRKALRLSAAQSRRFVTVFRNSKNLADVGDAARKYGSSPLTALFQAGSKELAYIRRASPPGAANNNRMDGLSRALLKATNIEISRMERLMPFLATTASVTPFIGLLGTVWGIMDAFQMIGIQRSASLVTVAPGIAEALVATALGLFAAIPAVIAYNHFLARIKETITEMEDFSLEFQAIAERLLGN
ncbi:MAG: protein TolQ [Acidobacteriota bacterium]|nr:protein TolQ [Acidobacteriota bacterium]